MFKGEGNVIKQLNAYFSLNAPVLQCAEDHIDSAGFVLKLLS